MGVPDSIFKAFYENLLLRDLLGKIIPGILLIFSIWVTFEGWSSGVHSFWTMSWLQVIALVIGGWIAGLVVQNAGKLVGITKTSSESEKLGGSTFIARKTQFRGIANDGQQLDFERFVVIKEAAGNTAAAMIFGICILVLDQLIECFFRNRVSSENFECIAQAIPLLTVLLMPVFLYRQHRSALKHEEEVLSALVGKGDTKC